MTPTELKTCPNCRRLKSRYSTWVDDPDGVCAGGTGSSVALLNCCEVTIMSLRAELAKAMKLNEHVDSLPERFSLSVFVNAGSRSIRPRSRSWFRDECWKTRKRSEPR